jgi:hypothetical protein
MHSFARSLVNDFFHQLRSIFSAPIDASSKQEPRACLLSRPEQFEYICFAIANMHASFRLAQEHGRLF